MYRAWCCVPTCTGHSRAQTAAATAAPASTQAAPAICSLRLRLQAMTALASHCRCARSSSCGVSRTHLAQAPCSKLHKTFSPLPARSRRRRGSRRRPQRPPLTLRQHVLEKLQPSPSRRPCPPRRASCAVRDARAPPFGRSEPGPPRPYAVHWRGRCSGCVGGRWRAVGGRGRHGGVAAAGPGGFRPSAAQGARDSQAASTLFSGECVCITPFGSEFAYVLLGLKLCNPLFLH